MRKLCLSALCLLAYFSLSAQWTALTPVQNMDIKKVDFPSSNVGFAGGTLTGENRDRVFKTTDGGSTWNPLPWFQNNPVYLLDQFWVNEQLGYAGYRYDSSGVLRLAMIKSQDGGANWQNITPNTSTVGYGTGDIFFVNADTGFFSIGSHIFRTLDGGANWTSSSMLYEGIMDLEFVDEQNGIAVGWDGTFAYKGIVWTTQNTGATWDTLHLLPWNSQLNFLSYPDVNQALAMGQTAFHAGQGLGIFRSTDQGHSWNSSVSNFVDSSFSTLTGFHMLDTDKGWASLASGLLIYTDDGGTNWTKRDSLSFFIRTLFFRGNTGYLGGDGGQVWILSPQNGAAEGSTLSGVKVSPNPVRDQLQIQLQDHGAYQIKVYSIDGQTLLARQMPGTRTATLSLRELPTGIYLLEVRQGQHRFHQKLVKY